MFMFCECNTTSAKYFQFLIFSTTDDQNHELQANKQWGVPKHSTYKDSLSIKQHSENIYTTVYSQIHYNSGFWSKIKKNYTNITVIYKCNTQKYLAVCAYIKRMN